jgi:hypothetical protein
MAMISVLGEWLTMSAREFSQRDSGTSDASEPEAVEAVKKRAEGGAKCGMRCSVSFFSFFQSQFN